MSGHDETLAAPDATMAFPAVPRRQVMPGPLVLSFVAHAAGLGALLLTLMSPTLGDGVTDLEVVTVSLVTADVLARPAAPAVEGAPTPQTHTADAPGDADADRDARTAATTAEPPPPAAAALTLPDGALDVAVLATPPTIDPTPTLTPAPPAPPTDTAAPKPVIPPDRRRDPGTEAATTVATRAGGAALATASFGAEAREARVATRGTADRYAREVVAAIGRSRPKGTGLKGEVVVEFALAKSGTVAFARVARSSGRDAVDTAAIAAVTRARYPTPPDAMSAQQLTYRVPFTFE